MALGTYFSGSGHFWMRPYSSVIQANGGKVEGLLSALRAKLTELRSGTVATTKTN